MLLSKYKLDAINRIFSDYKIVQPVDQSKIIKDRYNIATKLKNRYNTYTYIPTTINYRYSDILSDYNNSLKIAAASNQQRSQKAYRVDLRNLPQNPDEIRILDVPSGLSINISKPYYQPQDNQNICQQENQLPQINEMDVNGPPEEIETQPHLIEEENTKIKDEQPAEDKKQVIHEDVPVVPPSELPQEKPAEIVDEHAEEGKYSFPNNKVIQLPPKYSTNSEEENNAINILNEDYVNWEEQVNKPNLKIFSKLTKVTDTKNKEWDTAMIYVDATIDKPAGIVSERLHDVDLADKMGEDKENIISVQEEDNKKIIEKQGSIKMPFPFDDRETVTRSVIWKNYGGISGASLSNLKSINHPSFPENTVRAEYINRSTYVKPINDNQCKLLIANFVNLKVSLGTSMMGSKGAKMEEDWIKKFIKVL